MTRHVVEAWETTPLALARANLTALESDAFEARVKFGMLGDKLADALEVARGVYHAEMVKAERARMGK